MFAAGANSIFYGEKLLTTGNPDVERDQALFARLGLRPMELQVQAEPGGTVHAAIVEAAPARTRGVKTPASRSSPAPLAELG